MNSTSQKHVIVIGGGVAGIAAALQANELGAKVTLYESLPRLGGRAAGADGIDSGRHLVLSSYRDFLRLLSKLGSTEAIQLRPLTYHATIGDELIPVELGSSALPGPLSKVLALLKSPLIPTAQRAAAIAALTRSIAAAPGEPDDETLAGDGTTQRLRTSGRMSVADIFRRHRWPNSLVNRFGRPLAIGMGNAHAGAWAATPFLNALKRLLNDKSPRAGWVAGERYGSAISDPAESVLPAAGIDLRLGTGVSKIERVDDSWFVTAEGQRQPADAVIVTVTPARLGILDGCEVARGLLRIREMTTGRMIVTVRSKVSVGDVRPKLTTIGPVAEAEPPHAIWFMQPHSESELLLERVISGLDNQSLDEEGEREEFRDGARRWFGAELNSDVEIKVRAYPDATPTAAPGGLRPTVRQGPGLYYASDVSATGLPATLESAARAGFLAGRLAATDA